ncbi:MAG TPA: BTAD domain-containing putative transcriptional regulator [Bacillota bacterium]|nr:BTAD domain-containing putative transcriptional regulator [Bacillota bacterium]
MNGTPVLKSKLIMPELSQSFLLTERLKRLHTNMEPCRAVTVCAPAGYGKTSLAVSYFYAQQALSFRVCWYRPDPEDKNLSVFITHLLEAIFPSEAPEFAASREAVASHSDTQSHPLSAVSVICSELWAHHSHMRTYIVLDDFQNVAQVQDICDITRYLLDNLPPSCTLFILSRASHNVFTEKQKLEKKILEIDSRDLSFDNAEIEDLLFSMGQASADRNLTDIIEKSTEGWIAGVIILYQAVKSKGPDSTSFETGKLGHEDALFRYMSLEVLKSVDDDTQNALALLALLQEFSEAEASEILEISDITALIRQCMGFGMFIQRIPGTAVVYRFHSLFREFLLNTLKDRYPEEHIAKIHLKAAEYYMRHAAYGRFAEHLTKCGNSATAMDMVTKAGFNKFMIGETGQLKNWLDLLPEDMIMDNPILLLFKAQLMPNSRQPEIVDTLKKVLKLSLQDNNLAIYFDAASVLIYIYMCGNNMKGLLEMAEGNPKEPQNVSPSLKNSLAIIDMVRFIAEENFAAAEEQSESIQYALLPEDSQWLYLILSCIIYYCMGRLDHGERCMRTALELYSFKNIEPSKGFILLFLSIVLTLKNKRDFLPSHIKEVLAIGEKYDYDYLSAHGRRLAAFEQYLAFNGPESSEMLDHAVFHFLSINNTAMAAACRLLRCLWTIGGSSPAPILDDARKDIELIRKSCPGMMIYESSLSILGAIARESGDYNLAESLLLESIKKAKAKKGYQVLCGSYFHTARLYFSAGNAGQGHHYLRQAMELAAVNRYFMFWDIHIPTLVEMALRGIRYGYCPEYAIELLKRFYDNKTVNYLGERVKSMNESRITAFVGNFISSYKTDRPEQLYFVKAAMFGKPEISVNGIKIPDTEWKTKKVKGFFEYLLLGSGNTISKELLAEIFWPGSDDKSSIASQRTALYYLRKTLSKYDAEITGDNAFIYETPEGLQIRKNDALELDIHEFLRLYDQLSTEKEQTEILERMIELYKGDLMENSDYGDLVLNERERFKSIFMEACQKLGLIYMKRGKLQQSEEILRRAMRAEPYNEDVCLELLKLYMSQGRRSKAVKLYYSFKKHLEQELDIKIDKRLTEAIKSPGPEA